MRALRTQRKKKENAQTGQKKSTVKRLVVANLVVALALVTLTVTLLFAFGLLDTIFAFIF